MLRMWSRRRRRTWLTKGLWLNNQWSNLRAMRNHSQSHKEAWELNTFAITVEFKVTPDSIVISCKHWRIQVFKGQEDQEMTKEIGLLSNQEVEMVIPEWWMLWRWLMHSPSIWQVSTKGLEATTLAPNPIRISLQTHVTCGWKGVLMHKHYNMSMH